ncbi:MAG: 3-isopropylmalate dehydratase [Deltaproteobacteria bacterium]|nr:3-isopropylmalate dehydratase [Deltaproteobacteria bacterium]MBW2031289.1 3-isopropylmalate dehydratase [Deltaproteobacteria bacterium]MBW2138604.1 3-isopropylmalate dehydratase [Deltaproteobacteria bacterium]
MIIKGRVWKFGNDISTDYLSPSFGMDESWEERKRKILHIHKGFTREWKPGDVIVAGKNFGCGSSRESAPGNLKKMGIGCVVAESFARIFFRNCMAIAFPVTICKGVTKAFEEGDILELDFEHSIVRNLTNGKELMGRPLHPDLLDIVRAGGILESLNCQ